MRAFNRFYTELIGSLDEDHEGLPVSLVESRLLHAIANIDQPRVGQIADALRLDLAYTSRVLGSLEDEGLIVRTISQHDRRQRDVSLTSAGVGVLEEIEARSNERMMALVANLSRRDRVELLESMARIQHLLADEVIA